MSYEHRTDSAARLRTGDLLPGHVADALDAFVIPATDRIDLADVIEVRTIVAAPDYIEVTLADDRSFIVPSHWTVLSVRIAREA